MDFNLIKEYYQKKLFDENDLSIFVFSGDITSAQKLEIMVESKKEELNGACY